MVGSGLDIVLTYSFTVLSQYHSSSIAIRVRAGKISKTVREQQSGTASRCCSMPQTSVPGRTCCRCDPAGYLLPIDEGAVTSAHEDGCYALLGERAQSSSWYIFHRRAWPGSVYGIDTARSGVVKWKTTTHTRINKVLHLELSGLGEIFPASGCMLHQQSDTAPPARNGTAGGTGLVEMTL
jgi:hypothetical protein